MYAIFDIKSLNRWVYWADHQYSQIKNTCKSCFYISFSFSADTANETLTEYERSFQELQLAVNEENLTADVLEDYYVIDVNQTDVDGKVTCGEGETQVTFYCGMLLAIFTNQ